MDYLEVLSCLLEGRGNWQIHEMQGVKCCIGLARRPGLFIGHANWRWHNPLGENCQVMPGDNRQGRSDVWW